MTSQHATATMVQLSDGIGNDIHGMESALVLFNNNIQNVKCCRYNGDT